MLKQAQALCSATLRCW